MNRLLFARIVTTVAFLFFVAGHCVSRIQDDDRELSFSVIDADSGTALGNVVCKVYTAGGKFHAYGISDEGGGLHIRVGHGDLIEFSYVGYQTVKVNADTCHVGRGNVVKMPAGAAELREVTIKARPLTARGDTLVYNIGAFVKPGDVHLEDVLRKLPGIKVADNGTVSYQGKAINKFYIEGKDLLGNSYGQATRNMPVDAVASVEVLENHQPVRMLQGRQFSDKAALNIRLEKGHRARPFGEVTGGLGGSPTVWNNSLFLTQILGKSQLMLTAKMNNNGENLSDETREHIDITDLDAYEPLPSALLSTEGNSEPLPSSRYLHNKSYSGGLNYLTNVSANATLRFNVLAYEDHSSYEGDYGYTYGGINAVTLSETNRRSMRSLTLLPIIRYELNADRTYLSDELRYSYGHSAMDNILTSNGKGISERTDNRPSYLRNYLMAAIPAGSLILQAKSLLRYYDQREQLDDVSDSVALYNISDRYTLRAFTAKNIVTTSIPLWGNSLEMDLRANYADTWYGYTGKVREGKLCVSFTPRYVFTFGNDRTLSVGLPIEWLNIAHALHDDTKRNRDRMALLPSLDFNFKMNDRWRVGFSASMALDDMSADFYSPYILRTSYRTVYAPGTDVFLNRSGRLSARVNYRDLASMLFWNASIIYADERLDGYTDYDYTDTLTVMTIKRGVNHRRHFIASIGVDKGLSDAGLTLKADVDYDLTSSFLSQSGITTTNESNNVTASLSAVWQKFRWLRMTVGATGMFYWENNDVERSEVLSSFTGKASVYLFPFKGLGVELKYYQSTNELSSSYYQTSALFDVDVRYDINKSWNVGCSLSNLLNAKEYAVVQTSGINTSSYRLPLRGREIMFKIGLRL